MTVLRILAFHPSPDQGFHGKHPGVFKSCANMRGDILHRDFLRDRTHFKWFFYEPRTPQAIWD